MELRRAGRPAESTSRSEGRFRDGLSASHSFGNCIPFRMRIPGCIFRLRRHPETTSQSERGFRDALSAWASIGKARLTLRCCGARQAAARSASHLYLVEALRGESAYLLRKSAPASAACRRPRPLATNAPRLLNACPLAGSSPTGVQKKRARISGRYGPVKANGRGGGTRTHNPCGERF